MAQHTEFPTLSFCCVFNRNIHFHMPFLDGVYRKQDHARLRFHQTKAPPEAGLVQLTHTPAYRIGRYLERQGLLECDDRPLGVLFFDSQDTRTLINPAGLTWCAPSWIALSGWHILSRCASSLSQEPNLTGALCV